ncbi:MAG TPA: GxxExxY protein [Gemmatimonadales bacterium]|nr:GxxExxY protein [Gemmatimonadales bacterium]
MSHEELDRLSYRIIGAAIEVHRHIGPGLLGRAYAECLAHEFRLQRITFARELSIPVVYKGAQLDCGYRLDFLIEDEFPLELKTVEQVLPVHEAQVLTYLRLLKLPLGLLLNFNVPALVKGIHRVVNNF